MLIEKVEIHSLKSNDWNPNEMQDHIFHSLVASIKQFGLLQPILIRSDRTIIKGEKRWRAAIDAGMSEVLCVMVESSEEESKLLTVSLNHLRGQTNEEILASLVNELSDFYSLDEISTYTGFTLTELNTVIDGLETDTEMDPQVEDDGFDLEGAVGEIKEPQTKPGTLWRLGRHLLMCGDSTSKANVARLMAGHKADLVVTDPPYNVAVKSNSSKLQSDAGDKS
ncbi:ParB N-terminal domain-containing protein [Paenibacillus sp. S-38]|uniref:ParB/RepB/Spo0J family partition protein n=1 Tax=Paenibacillus sp. S-38 TaxID=3416710 RepID=UPI003CF93F84